MDRIAPGPLIGLPEAMNGPLQLMDHYGAIACRVVPHDDGEPGRPGAGRDPVGYNDPAA